jgi:hypothetical protein
MTNGEMPITALRAEYANRLMPMMRAAFPNLPAETASFAVSRFVEKNVKIDDAVESVNKAADDFTPEYGIMYPSVAYLLGMRNGKNPTEENPYLIDGKPFDQTYKIC